MALLLISSSVFPCAVSFMHLCYCCRQFGAGWHFLPAVEVSIFRGSIRIITACCSCSWMAPLRPCLAAMSLAGAQPFARLLPGIATSLFDYFIKLIYEKRESAEFPNSMYQSDDLRPRRQVVLCCITLPQVCGHSPAAFAASKGHQIPKQTPLFLTPLPFIPFLPFIPSAQQHFPPCPELSPALLPGCSPDGFLLAVTYIVGGGIKGTETHYSPVRESCSSAALLPAPFSPFSPPPFLLLISLRLSITAEEGEAMIPMTG